MTEIFIRNTTKSMIAVPGLDGHMYYAMPRAKTSMPCDVDGALPEGIVKVVVPSEAQPVGMVAPQPMGQGQKPTANVAQAPSHIPSAMNSPASPTQADPRNVSPPNNH